MLATMDEDETDGGPRSLGSARAPLSRLCLATRRVTPVSQMLRFVVGPDGQIVPDLARRLPGRGAWVSATRADFETALKKKAFGRAFKGKGATAPGLADLIDTLIYKDTLAALSLANKAGKVVTGHTKVEAALAAGDVQVLLHAQDARPDGVRKLNALARQVEAAGIRAAAVVDCFPGIELDLALGRSNVVHAALLAHPTAQGFLGRCHRLSRWRTGVSEGEGPGQAEDLGQGKDLPHVPGRMQGTDTE
ncbi:RNA-binding protein [Xanthobacter sp. KR7-65]|uniref:RNA-binding protein n=1 Tax=Xanthobacter sp. KR7-65 TaxID=3156612 RepID=UPI0032B5CE71